jgi:hypothetical protein
MKNIHLIPTDKPSVLILRQDGKLFFTGYGGQLGKVHGLIKDVPQHIYITNDEEIKEGDWIYDSEENDIIQRSNTPDINGYFKKYCEKIILTTDVDLIKDGVQPIDDEFLEWFVKNPSCEFVEVKKGKMKVNDDGCRYGFPDMSLYEIIIPQEEPKQEHCDCKRAYKEALSGICELCWDEKYPTKQETLEEVIFKVPFDYNIKPKEVIDMCMKEQENIILTWTLGNFIDMINSLPDDTEKNRILKSVFDNRDGELLLESYKSMKSHYEKRNN